MYVALLLSGGKGSRMGLDVPKQYVTVKGRPVFLYSLKTLVACESIDAVQIVAEESWRGWITEWMEKEGMCPGLGKGNCFPDGQKGEIRGKFRGFSVPGENRQLSILNGLRDICRYAPEESFVFIHDAARPLLTHGQIRDCLAAVKGHDGVLPVLPMKDAVYYSEDGRQVSLLERERIVAGQAPEVFRLGPYLRANERLLPKGILNMKGSTEPAVLAGLDVVTIPGDERNFKITTRDDLERFRQLCI